MSVEGRYVLLDGTGVVGDGPVPFACREIISVEGVEREIVSYVGRKYPSYKLEKALEVAFALRETGLADRLTPDPGEAADIGAVSVIQRGKQALAQRLGSDRLEFSWWTLAGVLAVVITVVLFAAWLAD